MGLQAGGLVCIARGATQVWIESRPSMPTSMIKGLDVWEDLCLRCRCRCVGRRCGPQGRLACVAQNCLNRLEGIGGADPRPKAGLPNPPS